MEIYIIVLLLLVTFAIVVHHYKQKQQKTLQMEGLDNVSHIKLLIGLVQTHRGLSSAWLNGDESKLGLLSDMDAKINFEIKYLDNKSEIKESSRWVSFKDHWSRLNVHKSDRDPENNFTQHTQIIANLLYLLEDEAERGHLNAISLPKLPNIGFVWRELVATTETIGQSRAIGTGVATRQECSGVHKIRLSFLQKNIQKTADGTLTKITSLENFEVKHLELVKIAKGKMEVFSDTIEKEIIMANEISISQDSYFALATDTIKALDDIFENQIEQVRALI